MRPSTSIWTRSTFRKQKSSVVDSPKLVIYWLSCSRSTSTATIVHEKLHSRQRLICIASKLSTWCSKTHPRECWTHSKFWIRSQTTGCCKKTITTSLSSFHHCSTHRWQRKRMQWLQPTFQDLSHLTLRSRNVSSRAHTWSLETKLSVLGATRLWALRRSECSLTVWPSTCAAPSPMSARSPSSALTSTWLLSMIDHWIYWWIEILCYLCWTTDSSHLILSSTLLNIT